MNREGKLLVNTGPGELSPGDILQYRYVIINKFGGGGMGTVYKASDNRVANRVVAIKEMKQDTLTTAQLELAYKRFEREAAILSLVQNEHLPRIHHFFEEAGRYYFVMQFIEGETLLQQVSTNQVPVLVAVDYALQLCDVLIHLHTRRDPIIFRDLKPSNIIIQPDGHLFLVDFGIARNFRAGKTSDTEFFGTPGYMAPEMSLTQTDARSDLFSLGVTLHFTLTGKIPEYVERNRALTPVLAHNAEAPAQLYALISKLVQMAPDARPQSAAEVKSQLERIQRQMLLNQVKVGQTGSTTATGNPLTFHQQPTVAGTRYQRGWRSPLAALEKLPGLLLSGMAFLLQPLAAGASKAASVVMSADARRDVYDRYLFLRVRLNNTGVWTTRFIVLLLSMLIGSIVLSVFIAAHSGASIYHVEFGLAFVLLVTIILSGGQLNNPVARNILLCTGFCVTMAFLTLLASSGFQATPHGSTQPMTLNLLMIYTLVTLTLIALLGNIAIRKQYVTGSKPAHGFTRLSHAGLAAVAGVCFLLQFAFGDQEQIIFFPATFRPFGTALSPSATTNIVPLALLGCVGIISLLRISQPFTGFDRAMLFTLCLLYVPAQYTFGLSELSHVFPGAFQSGLVVFNLLMLALPLVLAILAFFPLPDQMAWIRLLPLFAVSLGVAWLQGFLGDQEPFPALSSNSQQVTDSVPHLALFGQVVFFSLAIAIALLFIGIIFYRRAPVRAKWHSTSTPANTAGTARIASAADRIGMLGVALGCGAVQWAFWQGMLQNAPTLSASAQSANSLYAPLLSLGVGYTVMGISLLATGIVAVSALFNLSQTYARLAGLVKFLDRVTVLGITIIGLLLFSAFGNHGGWLANSLNLGQVTSSGASSAPASDVTIHYSLILMILIALFGLIALFRLTRAFGWAERVLLLLCGVGAMLMLTDALDTQQLPLLSANMQQAAGNFFLSLNADQVVALSLLIAALLSFAWLLSTTIVSDRMALGMVFGLVALLALIAAAPAQQAPVILAFIVMIQGVLVAAKVERVRRGNVPNAQP
jgi:tRNA A-37 threonylcarbamoyl transferase component Bud32